MTAHGMKKKHKRLCCYKEQRAVKTEGTHFTRPGGRGERRNSDI